MLKQYYEEILKLLSDTPKRYSDLGTACPNEATRSVKLREMLKEGLIETEVRHLKKRMTILYKITEKGKQIAKIIQ